MLETELIAVALRATPHADHLRSTLDAGESNAISRTIRAAFDSLAGEDGVIAESITVDQSSGFDSILYGKRAGDTVVAYSFSGLGSDGTVPMYTAAVAFFMHSFELGTFGSVITTVRALYNNLAVLRRPEDDDAIDVLQTVVAVRTQGSNFTTRHDPRTSEIIAESRLGEDRALKALKSLRERNILKVRNWGNQRDDIADQNNSWTFAL